ncbi:hypothetical protein [Streptomyces sp. NPDC048111]|uniref:hypothetical protein n=1 Tax=Streptomyces sp. NPDC048111 TaxID=3365500 RepID=UPI0037100878
MANGMHRLGGIFGVVATAVLFGALAAGNAEAAPAEGGTVGISSIAAGQDVAAGLEVVLPGLVAVVVTPQDDQWN